MQNIYKLQTKTEKKQNKRYYDEDKPTNDHPITNNSNCSNTNHKDKVDLLNSENPQLLNNIKQEIKNPESKIEKKQDLKFENENLPKKNDQLTFLSNKPENLQINIQNDRKSLENKPNILNFKEEDIKPNDKSKPDFPKNNYEKKESNLNSDIVEQRSFNYEIAREEMIEHLENFKLTNVKERLETIYSRYSLLSTLSPKNKVFNT